MNFIKKNSNKKITDPIDHTYRKLITIITWQGRAIVLLAVSLFLVSFFRFNNIALPSQEAIQSAPPIEQKDLQYTNFVYNNKKLIKHGETIDSPDIVLMGQIYDWPEVQKQWPDTHFMINGASVPLDQNGTFNIEFKLQAGANIIETSIRQEGEELMRRQNIVIYEPAENPIGPSVSAIVSSSTQP